MNQEDIEYFDRGLVENPLYWSNLGGKPDFTNSVVIDLGCGHGSLCIDIAKSGAKKVIGLDLNQNLIDFANENMRANYPELIGIVEFRYQDVCDLPESNIDFFVSKDTFEHVINLSQVLSSMIKRLKPGGKIFTGFGPLWNSPAGAHGRYEMPIRDWWSHLIFSERYYINRLNRKKPSEKKLISTYDLGLNKLSLKEYKQIFENCGIPIIFFRVNKITCPYNKLFTLFRKLPFMEEYFSLNIHCVLEKSEI